MAQRILYQEDVDAFNKANEDGDYELFEKDYTVSICSKCRFKDCCGYSDYEYSENDEVTTSCKFYWEW